MHKTPTPWPRRVRPGHSAWLARLAALGAALALAGCASPPPEAGTPSANAAAAGAARPVTLGGDPAVLASRTPPPWTASATYSAVGPFPVDLRSVPAGVFDPQNKLSRGWGLDGKTKRMRGPLPAEQIDRLREAAARLAPGGNIQTAPNAGPGVKSPTAGIGFDSIDINGCCGGGANVPPDPELAVGPNHIIAVVNVAMAIYDKAGNLLAGPTTLASFFAGTPGCSSTAVFDPNVLYDESTDRFIVGVDGNGTDYCVAATTGANPLGTWNRYGFPTNFGGAFFDYPHAGVGVDAIYMGSNQFGGTPGFEGRIFAMDKAALYSGGAMTVVTHSTGGTNSTPQPMNLHGFAAGTWPSTGPHYLMTEVFDGANHTVWSWNDPFGANTLVNKGNLNLNTATGVVAGFPVDVPQSGGANLQANDWRGLDTEYRNGHIWMTNTISCNPGSGVVNCLRWAQIDPTGPTVLNAGVYSSAGQHRFFPDLAVNQCGDMAIGYTKSSASMFPSIFVTGRESGDPAGQLQAEVQMKAGTIAYTAFDTAPRRWGDYTGMTIDPDGKTFWYLGEYSKNTGNANGRWGTFIGSYRFPSCGDTAPVFTLAEPVPGAGGTRNAWNVSHATPGSALTLFAGLREGSSTVTVAGCPTPIPVAMARARAQVEGTADGAGAATLQRRIAGWQSGRSVTYQAIDGTACAASNPVTVTID